jgi:hypothetical protein
VNRQDVEHARAEAWRFIFMCDGLLASKPSTYVGRTEKGSHTYEPRPWDGQYPSKEAASVKRSSLDLTRTLAHMRRRS